MCRNAKCQQSRQFRRGQYLDRMVIERFAPDRHKIVFKEMGDEHPDIDVDEVIATNRIRARSAFKLRCRFLNQSKRQSHLSRNSSREVCW